MDFEKPAVEGEVIPEVEEQKQSGFQIDDDAKAEYAVRRIKDAQANVEKFRKHFEEQLRKIEENANGICSFYMAHLERYFAHVPHRVTKTQEVYELPSVKMVSKKQAPEYIRDDSVIIEFVRWDKPELIKTKESIDWAEFKKTIVVSGGECFDKETGEKIPGISVVERDNKFELQIKEEKQDV